MIPLHFTATESVGTILKTYMSSSSETNRSDEGGAVNVRKNTDLRGVQKDGGGLYERPDVDGMYDSIDALMEEAFHACVGLGGPGSGFCAVCGTANW